MATVPLPIRVFVVDADARFVALARDWMATDPRMIFVGAAADARAALDGIARLAPEVVLVGDVLPGVEGLETARLIGELPRAPLVVVTSFADVEPVRREASAAGAHAFIAKTDLADGLFALVERSRAVAVAEVRAARDGASPRARGKRGRRSPDAAL